MRFVVFVLALATPSADAWASAEPIGGFGAAEQAWTLGLGALAIGLPAATTAPEEARWTGPMAVRP